MTPASAITRSKAGYKVIAPAWPGVEAGEEAIRKDPSPLNGLGVTEIADHYERIIPELETPPIIMGHSFGGVITQILLDRGLGAAGVAIDSGPIKGVFRLPLASLRSSFPVLRNPANRKRTVALTPDQFHFPAPGGRCSRPVNCRRVRCCDTPHQDLRGLDTTEPAGGRVLAV